MNAELSKCQKKELRRRQKQRDARMEQLVKELKCMESREEEGMRRNCSKMDEEEVGPDLMKDACPIEVKIGDLGLAYPVQDENEGVIQCRSYRAIEVILGTEWGPPVDIWSIAYLVN